MSTDSPRRSSHRAAGPVDGGTYVRREVDPSLSPRRRAKMLAEVNERQSPPVTLPVSDDAKDLLTSWLIANGFENLQAFQEMTREADSQRQHTQPTAFAPSSPPVTPAKLPSRSTPLSTRPLTPSLPGSKPPDTDSRHLDYMQSAPVMPETVRNVTLPKTPATPIPADDTASLTPDLTPAGGSTPVSLVDLPPEMVPTVSLQRKDLPNISVKQQVKPKTHSPRRAAKLRHAQSQPRIPEPLAKTKVVPIALTLGILLALSVALILLIMWYRSAVAVSDPAKTKIEVLGAIGAQPVLTLSEPLPLEQSSTQRLIKGEGQQIRDDSIVALRVTVFSGLTGKLQSAPGDESVLVGPLSAKVFGTELYNAVRGATEGSRYLLKQPVEQQGTSTMEIGVIDVIPTTLDAPMDVLPPDAGLAVSQDQGQVRLAVLADFSGDFRSYPLITGSGATVAPGQTVLVKYQEFSYSNPPALLKDHWSEPVKLKLDDKVQQGVARGIVDRKIGSRMLLEVPPAEGSGNQATILVVDILAAWDNPVMTKES